jgi:hypothetical protein
VQTAIFPKIRINAKFPHWRNCLISFSIFKGRIFRAAILISVEEKGEQLNARLFSSQI